jgi:hypothetical protein
MAIAQRAAQCALGLEGILQLTATEDARLEWENQIFRFNLWSANNFVFAPTRASMDWRLRNAPLLESSMCELLDDLQSSLIRTTPGFQPFVEENTKTRCRTYCHDEESYNSG